MSISAPPDPAWYLDNVVVPGDVDKRPVGPARAWRGAWTHEANRLARQATVPARERAVALALRQGFVLTRAQARACGMTDAEVRRLLRKGEWHAVGHGVVAVTPFASDSTVTPFARARRRHALACAAAALRRSDHLIAGPSASITHGLPTMAPPDVPFLVTAAPGTFGRRDAVHVRRAGEDPGAAGGWFGAPIVSMAEAIVETARFDARSGLMAADAALHEQLITPDAIAAALGAAADRPGIRRARQVLQLASHLIESPLESITHLALYDSGLPMPRLQRWVRGADGNRYRVDFLWPDRRLILEADGRGKYVGRAGWKEKRREITLSRAGNHVVRVVWSDVVDDWPATSSWLAELLGVEPADLTS